jgi:hypothetical protein
VSVVAGEKSTEDRMPLDVTKAPSMASPLWIVALFIALSEATAGFAAITTNGVARMIFTCFATGFPVLVFTAFIWLLVQHTPKLYSPGQYSKEITPEVFRTGIQISHAESINLGRAVAAALAPLLWEGTDEDVLAAGARKIAQSFEEAVVESSVTIVLSYLKPGTRDLRIPVTEDTTVTDLLDGVYLALVPWASPDSYQQTWTLLNEKGEEIPATGARWAKDRGMLRDERLISHAGIFPGNTLTAIAKGRPAAEEGK